MADSGKQEGLATVQVVDEIKPIPGAERIEHVRVGGWWVVAQKGMFLTGKPCVFIEVDCLLPENPAWSFLAKGSPLKTDFQGRKGYRLRTVRLRGALSQGLVLPPSSLVADQLYPGMDLTAQLGIVRWQAPEVADLAGEFDGDRPDCVPYTDQIRVQNLWNTSDPDALRLAWGWPQTPQQIGGFWEVTEKLDGMSISVFARPLDGGVDVGVTSRSKRLRRSDTHTAWRATLEQKVQNELQRRVERGEPAWVVQGELCGPGIQKNRLGLQRPTFFVYNIYDQVTRRYLAPRLRREACDKFGWRHVPYLEVIRAVDFETLEHVLAYAEGTTAVLDGNPQAPREGVVFKRVDPLDDGSIPSFKAVSNPYLEAESE